MTTTNTTGACDEHGVDPRVLGQVVRVGLVVGDGGAVIPLLVGVSKAKEHSRDVLVSDLAYYATTIDELFSAGVVG